MYIEDDEERGRSDRLNFAKQRYGAKIAARHQVSRPLLDYHTLLSSYDWMRQFTMGSSSDPGPSLVMVRGCHAQIEAQKEIVDSSDRRTKQIWPP